MNFRKKILIESGKGQLCLSFTDSQADRVLAARDGRGGRAERAATLSGAAAVRGGLLCGTGLGSLSDAIEMDMAGGVGGERDCRSRAE